MRVCRASWPSLGRSLCALLACILLQPGAANAADAAPAPPARLDVVADDNYPPYVFRGEDGRVQGLVVDLWALWQTKTGVAVNLQATDWDLAKKRFADGQAQVIDTIFRTPEREKVMDFTAPYADLPVPIYVHRDIGGITQPESLRGFLVAAKAGDACIDRLGALGVSGIERFDSYEKIVAAAAAGHVKIFCMDAPPANFLLYRAGVSERFRAAFVLYGGQFHRAVHQGDAATLALVERGFAQISQAEREALDAKWLGTATPTPATTWRRALIAAALLLAAVLALLIRRGLVLRRAVREKTVESEAERSRLRTLLNALPDLVWLKSPQGLYLACNERFEQFAGLSEARLVGHRDAEVLSPSIAHRLTEVDRKVLATGTAARHEFELRFANDMHDETVESLHVPVRDAHGSLLGVLGIARDVSRRRETERHLRRLNRLYRVLSGVHAAILREHTAEPLYRELCRILVEEGELRMAWVGVPDHAHDGFDVVASAGEVGDYLGPPHGTISPGPLGETACARALRSGRPAFITDLRHDPAMTPWQAQATALGYLSSTAFPLRANGQIVAVFSVYSSTDEHFDTDELALLDTLSTDIGRALEAYQVDAERARAAAALRDSEARFATVFKTSPSGMAIGRFPEGDFIDLNEAFTEMFGYTLSDVIGRNGIDIQLWVDPVTRPLLFARLSADGELHNLEVRVRRKDGAVVEASLSATRMQIGNESLMLAAFTDLAPQRLARRSLEERKHELEQLVAQRTAELSSVLDALPDLYFRMARDSTILEHRAGRVSDLLYATPSAFIGKRVRECIPEPAASLIEAAIERAFLSEGVAVTEYPLPLQDGEHFFEARLMRLGGDQVLAIVRNITDRRSLEAERERARLRAEELADAKSEFLANMSHEIRTPLNGLLGMAQIGLRESTSAAQRQAFSSILGAGRLLMGIVNDVLDFSKIEVGKLRIEHSAFQPRQLVEDCAVLLRDRAAAKHIDFTLEIDPAVPASCAGDPLRIQQVLGNLVSNAVKFTEQGGVRVSARTAAAPDGTAWLVFAVDDTGIGIAPDQLRQLFTAFQQADTSTTRRFGGTGLGLAISRRLAELMGGEIRVQSTLGQGSRFELHLPLRQAADADAGVPEVPWDQGGERLRGMRVLVAEDNEVNQLVLERALALEGAEVTLVGDGRQAVHRVLTEGRAAYDVVLMDIQMPEMDGYEATRRLLELAPDLPVIGQTAHALVDERLECLAAGMVDHIAKPIDFRQLVAVILRHHRPRS